MKTVYIEILSATLVRKIEKVAHNKKLTFNGAVIFLLERCKHPKILNPKGVNTLMK